jgi:hypothetical protein
VKEMGEKSGKVEVKIGMLLSTYGNIIHKNFEDLLNLRSMETQVFPALS